MLRLIVLILATLFLYFRLKKILDNNLAVKKEKFEALKNEYESLVDRNNKVKAGNSGLGQFAQEIIALYDITKDMCKTLDEDRIFAIFKGSIDKYVKVQECRFLKSGADFVADRDDTVFTLAINNKKIGNLITSGIDGKDKEKFQILAQQFSLSLKRALLYQKVQEITITDSLTQVFTRRHFLEKFYEELGRSKKFSHKLTFLMIDIDHFKDFNDHYGHLVGDAILREVSKAIKENIRQVDFMGRYGGEELSVVFTETDKEQAFFAAERIRKAIESGEISVYDEKLRVTISIGAATFAQDSTDGKALIDKADQALYLAKESGRNKTCIYEAPKSLP